jgi:hypothetical protein
MTAHDLSSARAIALHQRLREFHDDDGDEPLATRSPRSNTKS